MELQQLRYALAVVEHGTFTAAAEACFVAQPSLSHAIRTLERDLGVELFHRIGRRAQLTSAGEAFVPAARQVLRAVDAVRAEVGAVVDLITGRLDLVALPTLAVDPVATLVGAFRKRYPGVMVRLAHPGHTREVVQLLRTGHAELGITEVPVAAERIVTHRLGRQELVAAFPPGAKPPRRLPLAALAAEPLVSQPVGTSTRDLLDVAFAEIGATPRIAVETDQREAIVPFVLAGAGVAVLPRPLAWVARTQGAAVAPLDPPLWRDIGIVHRDAVLSPAAHAFLELASGAAPQH